MPSIDSRPVALAVWLFAAENKIMETEVAQLFSERLGKLE
jgi:hypothetical protein